MELLFYSHAFAPQVGGIETFSMHLACGLALKNCGRGTTPAHVTVVTQTAEARKPDTPEAPFQIIRRPGARRLWQLIGSADKVVLAGPAILPLLFALIRRKPVIVTHHGYQSICPNGLLFYVPTQSPCSGHFAARRYLECVRCNAPQEKLAGSIRNLLLTFFRRGLCWFADSNVAVSDHVARRIALPHAQVIRNGVPVMPPMKGISETSQTGICFAYVGRLVTEKGVGTLLDAARLLKARQCRFRVLIIGDGPEREPLQRMASSASVDDVVSFAGFLTGSQLQETLTEVSVVVVPSIWEEPAPLSPLEQMMQNRLVIGSNIGGLAEQIGDAGLRFEVGNSAALADQMQRVIEDPLSITQFGYRSRERALKLYSLDRMLQEYRILIQGV
jgi:glycosyltransferase involved in cell wall biosynthesis